jgi:hypothetical protein
MWGILLAIVQQKNSQWKLRFDKVLQKRYELCHLSIFICYTGAPLFLYYAPQQILILHLFYCRFIRNLDATDHALRGWATGQI